MVVMLVMLVMLVMVVMLVTLVMLLMPGMPVMLVMVVMHVTITRMIFLRFHWDISYITIINIIAINVFKSAWLPHIEINEWPHDAFHHVDARLKR